jgi:hypothetical protein
MILTHFYKIFLVLSLFWLTTTVVSAQTLQKFGDNPTFITDKAVLELESNSKGFLLPRMTKIEMETISNTGLTPEGLIVICTDCSNVGTSKIQIYTNNSWRALLTTDLDLELAPSHVLLGNAQSEAKAVEISGDITLDNAAVSTIGASKVLSSMILNGEIVNDDINSRAAILGTKINPTFGTQNVSTTGTLDAGATIVSTLTSLGTLGVVGAVDFDTTLNVGGATVLASTLAVTAPTTLADATVTGTLKVTGDPADFTQIPTAPTADPGTNTTQLATTAFVLAQQSYSSITNENSASTSNSEFTIVPEMSKLSKPGTYLLFFNSQYGMTPEYNEVTTNTAGLASDVRTLYTALTDKSPTVTYTTAKTLTNQTLVPGVYKCDAALNMNGTVTLDANNVSGAEFIFIVTGALNTAADTNIALSNGALASNVYFRAEGAVGIAATTIFNGTIVGAAAVAIGAGCTVKGRIFSKGGALSSGPGTFALPESSGLVNGPLNRFILFTAAGGVANTANTVYTGDIATHLGAITGFGDATVHGTIFNSGETTIGKNRNGTATFGLYNGDNLIPHSSRTRTTLNNTEDIYIQATTNILGDAEVDISVRWNIDAGEVYVKNRILTVIKVQ